jgi:hypothetical protein
MSKRSQIILKDPEYREIQHAARARHPSIAQRTREALEMSRRRQPGREAGKKLEVIRAAARLEFPTGGITRMLAEIEKRYAGIVCDSCRFKYPHVPRGRIALA